ncbi:WD40 repeat-like protein [Aspergillus indologenus CBS 114.80]|uniref:WD40 repeat-like protein n=1 Tax=Aspergillus indologenus CBS 114.80 TaxID=1450541 RepID=A0A2V5IHG7_9EURO|nr:WD40 repeat-like protein [Aspergillus indologenus CBS 114.80]
MAFLKRFREARRQREPRRHKPATTPPTRGNSYLSSVPTTVGPETPGPGPRTLHDSVDDLQLESGSRENRTTIPEGPLWKEALERLRGDAKMKKVLDGFEAALLNTGIAMQNTYTEHREGFAECDTKTQLPSRGIDSIEPLQDVVRERLRAIAKEDEVTILNHRVNIKAKIRKGVSFIQSTQAFISAAVSADPHASLAWAGILVILPILTRTVTGETDAVDGFNYVSRVLVRCRIIEERYFAGNTNSRSESNIQALETSARENLINLYASILQYEIRFLVYLTNGKARRFLSNLTLSDDWNTIWNDIKSHEEETRKDLEAISTTTWKNIENATDNWNSIAQVLLDQIEQIERDQHDHALYLLRERLDAIPFARGAAFDSQDNQHSTCLTNTRMELLEEIRTWAQGHNEHEIFWLKGVAGTGKSTIARTVATELHGIGCLVGSFFFARGHGDRGNGKKFVTSIARQLAEQDPIALESICKAYQEGLTDKYLAFQWETLIREPLSRVGDLSRPFILVVDALDECVEMEIPNIIKIFTQGFTKSRSKSTQPFRVFITSRPETVVRAGFENTDKAILYDLALDRVPEAQIKRDIRTYIEHCMREIRDSKRLEKHWPGDDNILELATRADRLFIYAATICRHLQKAIYPKKGLERILDANPWDSSTKALNEVYAQILGNYLSSGNEDEIDDQIILFQQIVGTIITLSEPLSICSLAALLHIEADWVESTIQPLYSVLDIPSDRHSPVKIFHQSFRDFLIRSDTCRVYHELMGVSTKLWVDETKKHRALVSNCFRTMTKGQHQLRKNICKLSQDCTLRADVDGELIRANLPPELEYSCRYWVHHMSQGSLFGEYECEAFGFLGEHLLHWFEAMSFLGMISEAILSIVGLETLVKTLDCQSSAVASITISSDGHRIFSASCDGTTRLWDTATGALLQEVQGYEVEQEPLWVTAALSPDCQKLACAAERGKLKLRDISTGETLQHLNGHTDSILCASFSFDSQLLLSGADDMTLRLWDVATGMLLSTFEGHTNSVTGVVFSSGMNCPLSSIQEREITVASCSRDKTIRLWDGVNGNLRKCLRGHTDTVWCVAFAPDNQQLASGGSDHTIRIWDVSKGQTLRILEHASIVTTVAFSPNGRRLASCSSDSEVTIWDPASVWDTSSGAPLETNDEHGTTYGSIAIAPDGRWLASAENRKKVRVWELSPHGLRYTIQNDAGRDFWCFNFSHDSCWLACGLDGGQIMLWEMATGRQQILDGSYPDNNFRSLAVSFSEDGKWIVSASDEGSIALWEIATNTVVQKFQTSHSGIKTLALSKDNQLLAYSTHWETSIWDLSTKKQLALVGSGLNNISMQFSGDGTSLKTDHGIFSVPSSTGEGLSQSHRLPNQIWIKDQWVLYDEQRILWLPPEYRPSQWLICDSLLTIGTSAGHVFFLRFDKSKLRDKKRKDIAA